MFFPKLTAHLTEGIYHLYSFHMNPENIALHKHLTTFKLKHVVGSLVGTRSGVVC